MLSTDVIILMESLLNKDLYEMIDLLKNKNINYAYDTAYRMDDQRLYIIESKRHNKYNNSYIYLAVKNEGLLKKSVKFRVVECKLYQVNKEQIYVVTTLKKNERYNIGLKDIRDVIVSAPSDEGDASEPLPPPDTSDYCLCLY